MLKGLYFMGWPRDMWNYHPSLPMRNMQMVEDIVDMRGDMLIWSCLGSGAIGLPYLDKEANEEVAPRLRFYGYMNDKEFCHECKKRGIKVFSVLWKAQLWEFAAEFNEDESELLSLNILRDAGEHKYLGMSELSTNRYPKLFDPIEKYFPNGLLDYKGEKVQDFLQEFKAVSLENRDILSIWLMAPDHDHKCYTPCCNKESYLSYMKKNVEMMIDAGVGGLHIDEYDVQKFVVHNAGCFCNECVDKFRIYLTKNQISLPEDAGPIDSFNYKEYLLSKGYKDKNLLAFNTNKRWEIPLYRHFVNMQLDTIEWVIRELSAHAKEYTKKTRGEDLPVTANLFQCYPVSWNCKKHLDILAGERTNLQLRQDSWYKFAFGWLNGKEACFVEDPNDYVLDMLEDIKDGINDRFILFLLEPIAHGFHLAFPYGSWLQNQTKDALWPDLRVLKKLGQWLDKHSDLFPKNPVADIGVIYDLNSAYENVLTEPVIKDEAAYKRLKEIDLTGVTELGREGASFDGDFPNFFDLIEEMSQRHVLYNVIYESPDEPLTEERLAPYKTVIVPDAFLMDDSTAKVLENFAKSGGELITFARRVDKLKDFKNYSQSQRQELVSKLASEKAVVETFGGDKYGFAVHQNKEGKYLLHIVNYNFNTTTHRIDHLDQLTFDIAFDAKDLKVYSFPKNKTTRAELEGGKLQVQNAGIYTVVEFL